MRRYGYSLLTTAAIVAGVALFSTPTFAQTDYTSGPETPLNTRIDRMKTDTDQALATARDLLQHGEAIKARQTLEAAEANLLSAEQFDISQAPDVDQAFGSDIAIMQAAINAIWKHEPKVALGVLQAKTAPAETGPARTLHSLMPPAS